MARSMECEREKVMNGQDYTFILAGKFGVGKTAIFKRIQTGEYLEQSSILVDNGPRSAGSNAELEHYLYSVNFNDMEYNVSTTVVLTFAPSVLCWKRYFHCIQSVCV